MTQMMLKRGRILLSFVTLVSIGPMVIPRGHVDKNVLRESANNLFLYINKY